MKKQKIDIVRTGDWSGLYINGKLKCQNHRVEDKDVLKALELNYEVYELDNFQDGHLPEYFADLKL